VIAFLIGTTQVFAPLFVSAQNLGGIHGSVLSSAAL